MVLNVMETFKKCKTTHNYLSRGYLITRRSVCESRTSKLCRCGVVAVEHQQTTYDRQNTQNGTAHRLH